MTVGDVVPAGSATSDLIDAIERHQTELSVKWTAILDGIVVETPGFVRTINPAIEVAFANNVHRIRLGDDELADGARECTAAFREHGVPALWWVSPSATPQEPGRELESFGWKYDESMPWMAARIDAIRWPGTPAGISIERVTDPAVHALFVAAMTAGFGMQAKEQHAMNSLAAAVGYEADADWVRWVGFEGARPVASAGLMLGGGVAGVYNIAVAPQARRRGIGAALTAAAIAEGRDRGYHVAVLGASELGYGVYRRMGFEEICRDRVWMLPRTRSRSKGTA